MTNKEVINKLKEYFLRQNVENVALMCASLLLDIHRFNNMIQLNDKEKESLLMRSEMMSEGVRNFVINGFKDDSELEIFFFNHDEIF